MKTYPPIKFVKGLEQKVDRDVRTGLSTAINASLEKVGSVRATLQNSTEENYGSPVHSLNLGGLSSAEALLSGVGTEIRHSGSVLGTGFSGERLEFASQNGVVYFTNPTDGLWYYNGSGDVKRAGVPQPEVGSFAATAGVAGTFSGIYTITCTFVNRNGYEGNATEGISTPALVTETINLTNIPVNSDPEYDVIYRRIYIQGGTTPAYSSAVLLLTIPNNTTTSWNGINSVEDSLTTLSTDNNLPPTSTHIFEHYGVMWLLEGQSARFAKVLSPEQWPLTQELNISRSGDPMQRGISWNGAGYIVTRKRVFEVIGSPGSGTLLTNFYVKETQAEKGTIAPMSVVGTPYGIFYQAEDGLMRFADGQSKMFSDPVEDLLSDRNKTEAVESLSVCEFWDDKLVFSFASASSSVPDTTLIYDFERGEWTSEDLGYRALASNRKENVLYLGTATGIDVFREGTGYKNWEVSLELVPLVGTDATFGTLSVNLVGTVTASFYFDDVLKSSVVLTSATKDFVECRFPLGMAERVTLKLVGAQKATQDIVYEVRFQAEPNQGQERT